MMNCKGTPALRWIKACLDTFRGFLIALAWGCVPIVLAAARPDFGPDPLVDGIADHRELSQRNPKALLPFA